jgi:hypothetical protein
VWNIAIEKVWNAIASFEVSPFIRVEYRRRLSTMAGEGANRRVISSPSSLLKIENENQNPSYIGNSQIVPPTPHDNDHDV